MTEQGWLTNKDPGAMLQFLRGKASDRKLRLFACEICEHLCGIICELFPKKGLTPDNEDAWKALRVAEQFANGLLHKPDELAAAHDAASATLNRHRWMEYALLSTARPSAWEAADQVAVAVDSFIADELSSDAESQQRIGAAGIGETAYEATFLRDIFGPLPFRAVTLNPGWRTANVTALAQAIYDERAFDRMPILADALEDAGCDQTDILNHCRQPGEHVRGCWVVDLVLGK